MFESSITILWIPQGMESSWKRADWILCALARATELSWRNMHATLTEWRTEEFAATVLASWGQSGATPTQMLRTGDEEQADN